MLLGSIGLRAKDFFFAANLAYFLMLLFCGVNIPLDQLPVDERGRPLPAVDPRHRRGARGRRGRVLGDVAGLVWTEASIAIAYAIAAFGLFRILERESRRRRCSTSTKEEPGSRRNTLG